MTLVHGGATHIQFTTLERPTTLTSEDEAVVVERMDSPIEAVGARDVIIDPDRMTPNKAYSYSLDGVEYVAVKRDNGRLDFYELPNR